MAERQEMNGKSSALANGRSERSIALRCLSHLSILLCTGAVFMLVTRSLANVKATAALGPAVIEQNGFFYGDEQYYVVSPPVIHVYYQPPADSDSASGMPRSPDGVKKPDSYFHETFVLAK